MKPFCDKSHAWVMPSCGLKAQSPQGRGSSGGFPGGTQTESNSMRQRAGLSPSIC